MAGPEILIAGIAIVVIIIICCACSKKDNTPLYQCECPRLRQKCVYFCRIFFIFKKQFGYNLRSFSTSLQTENSSLKFLIVFDNINKFLCIFCDIK